VPDCDGYSDGYSHVDVRVPGDGQIPVTHIEVESANYSKFFMDELYLNETKFGDNQWDPERGCDDCEADKILRQWGIDGGGTWDISLDPAKGVACVRFEVPNGLAYNCSTPTSLSTLYDCNITSVSHTDPICAGDSTGQAAVSGFQSNSPPFYYSWSNGSNSASVNNLPRGKHTVIVNDNSGCYKDTTIEIVDPPVENLQKFLILADIFVWVRVWIFGLKEMGRFFGILHQLAALLLLPQTQEGSLLLHQQLRV
jgi:hypothetical protein